MKQNSQSLASAIVLGIEGGGTRTVAIAVSGNRNILQRWEGGPANLRMMSDAELERHFWQIFQNMPQPQALGIGLAGAREPKDWARIRKIASHIWKDAPCHATHDLETALAASGPWLTEGEKARMVVISGTGSSCFGQNRSGQSAKSGGWGHVLGDRGSGFHIGLRGLQEVIRAFDESGTWPLLGTRILRALQYNDPDELVQWSLSASKVEMAALAQEIFAAAQEGDRLAELVLREAAEALVAEAVRCAAKLAPHSSPVRFILTGGNLLKQPFWAGHVGRLLRREWPGSKSRLLHRESVWGAVELAYRLLNSYRDQAGKVREISPDVNSLEAVGVELNRLPTEQRNPRSMNLDRMKLGEAIHLMLEEDRRMLNAVKAEHTSILKGVQTIVRAMRRKGRLFYVGAGTSGRLGVLDASECPPTFRTPPDWVQGIIAGGQRALWEGIEGAEDDASGGAQALRFRGVTEKDVVVGIAASGRTPFVRGALREARHIGAATILLCFNPKVVLTREEKPTVLIAPNTGPEILTGSTRLKAGTATKIILNIFTTLTMVQLGKVASNLMIDVNASNVKLRARAIRIVQELTGAERLPAEKSLSQCQWNVKEAAQRLRQGAPPRDP